MTHGTITDASTDTTTELIPPAGSYPSGHAGTARIWDGDAWTSTTRHDPAATEIHAHRRFWRTMAHWPFWCAFGGIIVGLVLAAIGGYAQPKNDVVLGFAGLFATGGPLLAVVLGIHRRLGIGAMAQRHPATWWGLLSGAVAVGLALLLEIGFEKLLTSNEHAGYAFAGPAEEFSKLLVPVIFLLSGAAWAQHVRLGVWAVTLTGATFGTIEGIKYAIGLDMDKLKDLDLGSMSEQTKHAILSAVNTGGRSWVELLHVFITVGAAVLIWFAAHHHRHLGWTIFGAWIAAAAMHSFNDAVLTLIPSIGESLSSAAFVILVYTLWFRPLVRRTVPPTTMRRIPARWIPRLPRHPAEETA